MNILSGLNEKQIEAVTTIDGQLLIIAGAGSGKTRVLCHRVAHLIEHGVSPENILAVTFTNKAAGEMKERITNLLKTESYRPKNVSVGTFHSLCVRILRQEIDKLGHFGQKYGKNFVIYGEDDQESLVKKILQNLSLDTKQFSPRSVLSAISAAKNEFIEPEAYESGAKTFFQKTVAKIYAAYQKALEERNALDFDDLLNKTLEIFQKFPSILEKYQEKFRYILVDEYQDTNRVQYLLIKLLAQKYGNLCIIGDPDQSIYGWRGADFRNIQNFERDYPQAKTVVLGENYRSTKTILEAADSVISKNKNRKEKKLWTKNPAGRDYVKGDIDTTQEELDLIYYDVTITTDSVGKITNDPDNFPGIHQMLGRIWPKAQKLDECIPGPDLGWQKRLDEEVERIKKELQEKSGGMIGGGNVPASEAVVKELTSAVSFFKDWINDKIMSELDSSVSFVDAVSSVKALSEEMDQLKGKRETRSRALVRLKAIEKGLSKITTQPTIGSAGEKSLISLWKQYQAAKLDLSNTNTVEETRNKLSEAIDLYNNFIDSMDPSKDTSCPYEREDSKKWYYRPNTTQGLLNVSGQSDLLLFCALPIRGGYDHGGVGKGGNQLFSHENDIGGPQPVTHPEIPLVNAREVWDYEIITLESLGKSIGASFIIGGGLFSPLSLYEEAWYDINLNCDNIFNAGILEYKGKLPGNTSGSSTTGPTLGNCTYSNGTVETNKTKKQCELETGTWGPLEPLGVCSVPIPNTNPVQTLSVPNTTRLSCTTYNGTWTSNSGGNPTTPPPATPNNLVFTPANLSIEITEENQLPSLIRISGGTPPYAVISPQDTGVFIVKILSITPNFLTVTGYSSGTSSVFIMDSSNPSKFASINIKVEVNLPINI